MKKFSETIQRVLRSSATMALLVGSTSAYAYSDEGAAAAGQTAPTALPDAEQPVTPLSGDVETFAGDVSGTAGRIRSFEGSVAGSAGRIRSFAGEVASFAGRIRSFEGEVYSTSGANTAFWGSLQAVSGSLVPEAGSIRSFSGELESTAGRIRSFTGGIRAADGSLLSYAQAPKAYNDIAAQISALVTLSKATFGPAVEAETGLSFDEAFTQRLFSKYGIDLNNPSSLAGLNELDIELFLLDWNDNLMNYSGHDQVDHWMKTVNWTPSLTQDVIGGFKAKIGLLDFTVTGAESANIVASGGISEVAGGHGSGVASLIIGAHDGRGIMGISPTASVVSYNPFDSTNTAGWDDIRTGIRMFADQGVSVVNISLGVPGWTLNDGWNDVFKDPTVSERALRQLFVMAAGNDGVVQPADIEWSAASNPVIIVVGSVNPSGVISAFSNTPGNTCLLRNGVCASSADKLMNRFLVAPGEFILVSDGAGGVTRSSGTSFAAPLVSGTAALIADRWPWLAWSPNNVADIILNSAKDLGAPGVDPVYGHGLLDVTAALSPLNFESLTWYVRSNGEYKSYSAITMPPAAVTNRATWEANSAYVTVYEKIGSTQRDFLIPLSTKLSGTTLGLTSVQFQDYLSNRFWAWVASKTPATTTTTTSKTTTTTTTTTTSGSSKKKRFAQDQLASPLAGFGQIRAEMTLMPRTNREGFRNSSLPFDSTLSLSTANNRIGFEFGSGNGSVALGKNNAFGLFSDYDVDTGGANPFLALASGNGYMSSKFAISDRFTLSTGFSEKSLKDETRGLSANTFTALSQANPYKATANTVSVTYQPTQAITTTANYTLLREKSSLLGVRSSDVNDFGDGSVTDAATYGVDVEISPSLTVGASATLGRTRAGDKTKQNIVVSQAGLISTAFQFAVEKSNLFDEQDTARISLSQPLFIERGSIDLESVQVVDRQTGELGVVTQKIGIQSGKRSFVTEAIYRRTLLDGKAELNLFGRARIGGNTQTPQDAAMTMGVAFHLAF